jgi:CBS-domain-containing membrane protein
LITAEILDSRRAKRFRFGGPIKTWKVATEEFGSNHTIMKTKSAIDQVGELAPKKLKEIVHGQVKTFSPQTSVQEACDELRSEGVTWSPVIDRNGQLLGTVSEKELNRKVGGFGHDPKIELAQTELNREPVYCFEDQTIAEAEKLMREGNLRRLPVLTREKRMVGIVTLEDIAREPRTPGR